MRLVRAGPLDPPELVEAGVGHAGVHGREAADLLPNLLGGGVSPIGTEALGDLADQLDVVAGAFRRAERTAHALYAPLAVGDRALRLSPPRSRGQHHVRELGGLGEEDVLHDEMVEAA